jgi:hypothetical protein
MVLLLLNADAKSHAIAVEAVNCHGFKESLDFISKILSNTDCMCLSETWIKPSEHSLIQRCFGAHVVSTTDKCIVVNKSGMFDDDEHSLGRPYGGIAIICNTSLHQRFSIT